MLFADRDSSSALAELRCSRQWIGLALSTLVMAGLFALAVVVGRTPPFDRYVTDPLFFKRCLVAHVNLALVVWFYSFITGLLFLLPGRDRCGWIARNAVILAGAGVVLQLLGAGMPGSQPILSNYIPTIDHGLFQLGQLLFGAGVLASFLDRRLLRSGGGGAVALELSDAARYGLRAAGAALVLSAITFAVSWYRQPLGVEAEVYFELLAWGGGHVLQLVCSIAMVSVWLILLRSALGRSPVSGPAGAALFAAMLLPWSIAPLLALQGTWTSAYRTGFTQLMQWCIFPVVGIFLILCVGSLLRARREGRLRARDLGDPRISGFLVSAGLTVLGFALGAAIRGANTMVPAHYHASVGAVTVAFMASTYLLLGAFRRSISSRRLARAAGWQPPLYGGGMLLFAGGFALAGAYGMGRKAYGAEQAARGLAETIGLGMMGLGGFVAIAGGLLFLGIIAAAWWRRVEMHDNSETRLEESRWRWPHGVQRPG
jgi:hypothetical protein